MKSFRGTYVLSAVVVLLAGYTAWEFKKAERDKTNTPLEKHLFTILPDKTLEIKVTRKDVTIQLQRTDDGWIMKQPVEDAADGSVMDSFLYNVTQQKGKAFGKDEDSKSVPIHWADYGLEPAGTTIEVISKDKTETLAVSSKNAFDGSFYVRQGDELFLGDPGLAQISAREPSSFRSRHLWRDKDVTIDSATAEVDAGKVKDKFTITFDKGEGVLSPAPSFPVDKLKLVAWVEAIKNLTPSEIVSEQFGDDEKHKFLMLKPSLVVHLNYKKADGTKAEWVLQAGQDLAEDVFLQTSVRPTVYKTRATVLHNVRVNKSHFRDGKPPFRFAVEAAHEVQVWQGKLHGSFKKEGATWKQVDGAPGTELDVDKLVALIQNISVLDAQEFLPLTSAKGFSASDQRVLVTDEQGKTLLDLKWGDEYKSNQQSLRYVRTNLENEAMGMSAARLTNLVDKALVKEKKPEPEQKTELKKVDKK